MKKVVLLVLGCLILFARGVIRSVFMQNKNLKREQLLRFALPIDVVFLDVNSRGHDINTEPVMNLLFEGLIRRDEKGIPQLAIAHKI